MRVTVKRSGTFEKQLSACKNRIGKRVRQGLLSVAERLLEMSNELVPRDTDALIRSGKAYVFGRGLDSTAVTGYGSTAIEERTLLDHKGHRVKRKPSEYAVFVHEGGANMPPLRSGKIKFLETPYERNQAELRAALMEGIGR